MKRMLLMVTVVTSACSYKSINLTYDSLDPSERCSPGDARVCGTHHGQCRVGVSECTVDGIWGACIGHQDPAAEVCDGYDNDCDTVVDEDCPCQDSDTQQCWYGDGVCAQGVQTCAGGAWGPCEGQAAATVELCDGIDNDCDGIDDNGCDDDGDGYCDDGMQVVGTPAVCPQSQDGPGNDCDDNSEHGAETYPGAHEIVGNNHDNDCDGAEKCFEDKDGDGYHDQVVIDDDGDLKCETSDLEASNKHPDGDCNEIVPTINPGADEIVDNDSDDDCNDEELCYADQDDDGYRPNETATVPSVDDLTCDGAGEAVAADPTGDCDDEDPAVKPGGVEICITEADDNCDGRINGEDLVQCAPFDVTIRSENKPLELPHYASKQVTADITPATDPAYSQRSWQVFPLRDGCSADDIVRTVVDDNPSSSTVAIEWGANLNPATKRLRKDCVYALQVFVSGHSEAYDSTRIAILNGAPTVFVRRASLSASGHWGIKHPSGVGGFAIEVEINDPDSDPLKITWAGDIPSLQCYPNCDDTAGVANGTVTEPWIEPTVPGQFNLTINVDDGLEAKVAQIQVTIEPCVWVELGGDDDGSQPREPMGSIREALEAVAIDTQYRGVCVIGDVSDHPCADDDDCPGSADCVAGGCAFDEYHSDGGGDPADFTLPWEVSPDLIGGFADDGTPNNGRARIRVASASGVIAQAGYVGTIKNLEFYQQLADSSVPAATVVDLRNSSASLVNSVVHFHHGGSVIGVDMGSSSDPGGGTVPGEVQPAVVGSVVSTLGRAVSSAVGVRIVQSGVPVTALVAATTVIVGNTTAPCQFGCSGATVDAGATAFFVGNNVATVAIGSARGLDVLTGSTAYIDKNYGIAAVSFMGDAYGIHMQGSNDPVYGAITENIAITAAAAGARAVAVQLFETSGLSIANNRSIGGGPERAAGSWVGAAIVDGELGFDGTPIAGGSRDLEILGNTMIQGLHSDAGTYGAGAAIVAGVLLIGTKGALIEGNGDPKQLGSGILGGTTTASTGAIPMRPVPQAAVGLWLLGTEAVTVRNNEIFGGIYDYTGWTSPPDVPAPASVGLRDGFPGNGDGMQGQSVASAGLVIDGNGISCGVVSSGGADLTLGPCTAVELNRPAAGGVRMVNNYVAAQHGTVLVGLKLVGGAGHAELVNNTFDADLVSGAPVPLPTDPLQKYAVVLQDVSGGQVQLVNNIILAHIDEDQDDRAQRLCILEKVVGPPESNLFALQNNLFFIGGDDDAVQPGSGDVEPMTYVRIEGTSPRDFSDRELNDIVQRGGLHDGNFASAPGLKGGGGPWSKSRARLRADSPARDAATNATNLLIPELDIEGDHRFGPFGGAVDIGHDEYSQR